MTSTKKIIEEIRRLSARDRRTVIKQVEQLKTTPRTVGRRPAVRGARKAQPYAALIELAGVAHGDYDNVSTDKYRNLAAAYANSHEAK